MDYGAIELIRPNRKDSKKQKTIPFRQTNRFFRGRIVDLLRDGELSKVHFIKIMIGRFHKPPEFFQSIIQSLINDGLIEQRDNSFRLPE